MIPEGTRFIGISPNVNLTEKKSAVLNAETQPYTLDDIRGYKMYTALVSQTGTSAPVVTVLDNTIGNIVWTYDSTGEYIGTLTGVFISGKVYFSALPSQITQLKLVRLNNNSVNLGTVTSGVKTNGLLSNTPIEIRIYN
jgi:hypothetical protein